MDEMQKKILNQLGLYLKENAYRFTTITPASHKRVLERAAASPNPHQALRDLFGWNKQLPIDAIDPALLALMDEADILQRDENLIKSRLRVSTLDDLLFFHSSFPTSDEDSVFFGPDTYRFVRFLKEKISSAHKIADIGTGSGAGALCLTAHLKNKNSVPEEVYLTDINQKALDLARANAQLAQAHQAQFLISDILQNLPRGIDLLIANPPFIIDSQERTYRHGGGLYGAEFSLKIVRQALDYLKPGGRLAVYTGSPIVAGKDIFLQNIEKLEGFKQASLDYQELDPDIFGEELSRQAYSDVDRIAAVGLILTKSTCPLTVTSVNEPVKFTLFTARQDSSSSLC